MRAVNELVIRGPHIDIRSLLQRLETSLKNGWRRDRVLEERLRGTSLARRDIFCFSCEEASDRPAVALWFKARSAEEWHVSSVIPLNRPKLSDDEYNRILDEFETTFLSPLAQESAVHTKIFPPRIHLEYFLSSEGCRRLKAFSSAANHSGLHPNDRLRWHAFLNQAHREDSSLDSQTLDEWLTGEGWPEEIRRELIHEYETGRVLLTHYDEEQNR